MMDMQMQMQMRREDDERVASSSTNKGISNNNYNDVGVGVGSRSSKRRGCIRSSKGPWLVRRMTKNKGIVTNYRHPSEKERLNNKRRERKRRSITHNIFAGLKAHGNYQLPKNADTNDLLKALCQEAGWHVHEDGTIFRSKNDHDQAMISNSTATAAAAGHNNNIMMMASSFGAMEDEKGYYCNCKEKDELLLENAQQLGVYNFKFYQLLPNSMDKVPDTTLSLLLAD